MENRTWYDVFEYIDGSREIVHSSKTLEEAEEFASNLHEVSSNGIVITVNEIKNNKYKIVERIIIHESEAVKKHYKFLQEIDEKLSTQKRTTKKKKKTDVRNMKKEYHF